MDDMVLFAAITGAIASAVLLIAPLMFFSGALVRAALWNRKRSELLFACLPALAELFVALAFTASLTGGVRALSGYYPDINRGWLWAIAFAIGVLPGVIRWAWDFLADPSGRPSFLPVGLEVPILQPLAFLLFAIEPNLVATVWGWVPFAAGAAHPAWASAVIIGGAVAALKAAAVWSDRQVRFIPTGAGLWNGVESFVAKAGR